VTVALVGGALADAFDRRTLVLLSDLGSAVMLAALLANSLLDEPQAWVLYTSGPTLGNFEAGVVASFAGVRASIVSGGIMCVVGTGVILEFLPALWRYDARHEVRA
jgi:hypothetical protein